MPLISPSVTRSSGKLTGECGFDLAGIPSRKLPAAHIAIPRRWIDFLFSLDNSTGTVLLLMLMKLFFVRGCREDSRTFPE